MITVLLPVMDSHHITDEAIKHLIRNAHDPHEVDIMVVDNASTEPYPMKNGEYFELYDTTMGAGYISVDGEDYDFTVFHNRVNRAGYGALLQVLPLADYDIVLWMHNDVLIHEKGWDKRIIKAFEDDPLLGIAGFFGAPGVASNGGRIGSMGNMLGKVWGSPQEHHGQVMTGIYPAVVFDSLAIIIRRSIFEALAINHNDVPPHHWNDRILPLLFVDAGYHAATIGIAHDHHSGVSSLGEKYRELAERWSREHNVPFQRDWDYTFYSAGERYFRKLMGKRDTVVIHKDYTVGGTQYE